MSVSESRLNELEWKERRLLEIEDVRASRISTACRKCGAKTYGKIEYARIEDIDQAAQLTKATRTITERDAHITHLQTIGTEQVETIRGLQEELAQLKEWRDTIVPMLKGQAARADCHDIASNIPGIIQLTTDLEQARRDEATLRMQLRAREHDCLEHCQDQTRSQLGWNEAKREIDALTQKVNERDVQIARRTRDIETGYMPGAYARLQNLQAAEDELNQVRMSLARRGALDGIPDLAGKIEHACREAGKAEGLREQLDASEKHFRGRIDELRQTYWELRIENQSLRAPQKAPQVDPPAPSPQTFEQDLAALINRHTQEQGSDTPDFVLAHFLDSCLRAFDQGVRAREDWYEQRPTGIPEKDTVEKIRKDFPWLFPNTATIPTPERRP